MKEDLFSEKPVVFECQGDELIGIAHIPVSPASIGVVCVIAGGPQYRAGVGRNMVLMARNLAAAGIAVFRFDHRGLGDSSGEFSGFEHTREDMQAAVECFQRTVPEIREVVLWGGCDAASGCMIHGCDIEGVGSMVLGNPWITTSETEAVIRQQHYLTRLRQWSFWQKLLRFEYDLTAYARSALARLRGLFGAGGTVTGENQGVADHWIDRMLQGLRRFDGPVLFLMSGQSMASREFDELVASNPSWKELYGRPTCHRIDLPDADQTFSTADSREQVNRALREWVQRLGSAA